MARQGKTTEAQMRASIKYQAENIRQIKINLNRASDADIIAKLDSVENKQGYIKALIREDLLWTRLDDEMITTIIDELTMARQRYKNILDKRSDKESAMCKLYEHKIEGISEALEAITFED